MVRCVAQAGAATAQRHEAARSGTALRAALLPRVKVHVWSDVACPWCYVGKQRLQKAIREVQQAKGAEVEVLWNPFIIDPQTDPQGEEYLAYNKRRWGSDSWTTSLRRSGTPDGATFNNWRTWPNTLLAHQLVAVAAEEGLASQAEDVLFRRTYEEGGNVSLVPELEAIGEELGLDMDRLHSVLTGKDGGEVQRRVLERDAAAKQQLRIKGVPHFIMAAGPSNRHKYALSGAQQPDELVGAMLLVAAEASAACHSSGSTMDLLIIGSQELAVR